MKKKTFIGAIVMAAAILLAVPVGANRSFDRLYDEAKQSYYYDDTGYALYQGLETRQSAASNLVTLGKRYASQSTELASATDLLEEKVAVARNKNYSVDDLAQEIAADKAMGSAAQSVADLLEQATLSEKDAKYPSQLLADLNSEADKLARSSYNDDARAYNAKLEGIPVKWLLPVAGIRTMAVYE